MSILIKGMEMPKTCWDCACSNYYESIDEAMCDITDEQLDYMLWKCERHPDCPLIELPPHGDLVDRNELLAEYDRQHEGEAGKARKIMEQAKAVIEAEGET